MMRLLGILVVLFALVAGVGYYRGWFHADAGAVNNQSTLTVTVDKDKIDQDKAKAQQEVQDLGKK
jgi:hypothetical protein